MTGSDSESKTSLPSETTLIGAAPLEAQLPPAGAAVPRLQFETDTRGRLLRATMRVVARGGVRAATVQQILDDASVSRRTFYKHFRSAEDACDVVFEAAVDLFSRVLAAAASGAGSSRQRIERTIDAYLDLQVSGGPFIAALQFEAMRQESPLASHRARLLDDLVAIFTPALGRSGLSPLAVRGTLLSMEGLSLHVHHRHGFDLEQRQRVRDAYLQILERLLPEAPEA